MRIDSLVPSEKVQGRWLLTLEDGTKLKITDREMVDFALYAGLDLSPQALEQLKDAAGESRARRRAANILSARPLSRKELQKRLMEKGESEAHALAACDYMEHLGYLNDRSYAVTLVRYYSAKGFGPRKIRDEFYRRGVPREFWDEVLEEMDTPEDAIDRFVEAKLRRIERPDKKDLKRLSDALLRRGYSWGDVSSALNRYTAEHDWEDA